MKKSLHEVFSFFTTSVLFLLWFCLLNKHETNVQMIVYCYTLQWIVLRHKNQREHTHTANDLFRVHAEVQQHKESGDMGPATQ